MPGENRDSARSDRPRRKSNEQAIKTLVVVIGSVMMITCFSMLLGANLRGYGELGQTNTIIVLSLLLSLTTVLFVLYIYIRLNKFCRQPHEEEQSVTENNGHIDRSRSDRPPSYDTLVETPPPAYTTLKIPCRTERKLNEEFTATHI